MAIWMWIFFIAIICQRLMELRIAKRNERWMKERGGIEKGTRHYKWFIVLHSLFFMSILLETSVNNIPNRRINYFFLLIFITAQLARVWCIHSLGRFWNTKIIVLPSVSLIKKGPYKYVKHPNYIIVAVELFFIPLLFGAYITAMLFPIFHFTLLRIRIPQEEKALTNATLPKL